VIITARRREAQLCWSEPWTGFSARTIPARSRSAETATRTDQSRPLPRPETGSSWWPDQRIPPGCITWTRFSARTGAGARCQARAGTPCPCSRRGLGLSHTRARLARAARLAPGRAERYRLAARGAWLAVLARPATAGVRMKSRTVLIAGRSQRAGFPGSPAVAAENGVATPSRFRELAGFPGPYRPPKLVRYPDQFRCP
jgi:hypothetical protein